MRVFIYLYEEVGRYIGRVEYDPPYMFGSGRSINECLQDLLISYPTLENSMLEPVLGTYEDYLTQIYRYVANDLLDKSLPLQKPQDVAKEFWKRYQRSHLSRYWPCDLTDPQTINLIKACLVERYYPFGDEFIATLAALRYEDNNQ